MIASQDAYTLIKRSEGLRLEAYRCEAGRWSIGYGSRRDVTPGLVISEHEAMVRLYEDIGYAQKFLESVIDVEVTQHQFDALVAWCYNVGSNRVKTSTLIKRLNAHDPHVSLQFARWNKVTDLKTGLKRPSHGLTIRRKAEQILFDQGILPLT